MFPAFVYYEDRRDSQRHNREPKPRLVLPLWQLISLPPTSNENAYLPNGNPASKIGWSKTSRAIQELGEVSHGFGFCVIGNPLLLLWHPQMLSGGITRETMSGVAQWLACWAHNPKVRGSKPRSAIILMHGRRARAQAGRRAKRV